MKGCLPFKWCTEPKKHSQFKEDKAHVYATQSQANKWVKESPERHRAKEIDNSNIQKAKEHVGLTEAQQKEVEIYHAKIRRRISYSIGF